MPQSPLDITDIKMPHADGIDAAVAIYRDQPLPVILVSAFYDPDLIQRAESDHVVGYLVKPIKQSDLVPAIALAMRCFEQFHELRREATDLRQALEDRKVKRDRIDKQAAFGWLKKQSDEERRRLVEIAQSIVVAEEGMPDESRVDEVRHAVCRISPASPGCHCHESRHRLIALPCQPEGRASRVAADRAPDANCLADSADLPPQ